MILRVGRYDPIAARAIVCDDPAVPIIRIREDAERLFGKHSTAYNLACAGLDYADATATPVASVEAARRNLNATEPRR